MSSKTHHPAAPKPRIPPARIPEIALRSPPAWDTFAIGGGHAMNYNLDCNHIGRHPTVWGTRPKTTAWNDRRGETDAQQTASLTTHGGATAQPPSHSPRHPVKDEADESVWWTLQVVCRWLNKNVNCFCLTVCSTVLEWASSLMLRLSKQLCAVLSVLRSCALVKLCSGVSRTSAITLVRVALASVSCCTCFCSCSSIKASLSFSGAEASFWRRGMAGLRASWSDLSLEAYQHLGVMTDGNFASAPITRTQSVWKEESHPGAPPGGFLLLVLGIIHVFSVVRAFFTAGCLLFCTSNGVHVVISHMANGNSLTHQCLLECCKLIRLEPTVPVIYRSWTLYLLHIQLSNHPQQRAHNQRMQQASGTMARSPHLGLLLMVGHE